MAQRRLQALIGVGRRKIGAGGTPDAVDFATARYAGDIKASFDQIIRNFEKVCGELKNATPEILYDALYPTFLKSQTYCPVATGALKASGHIEIQKFGDGSGRVIMGYAKNGEPPYAALVHELTHLAHEPPTRAKFLLAALEEDNNAIQQRIVKGYKEMFA